MHEVLKPIMQMPCLHEAPHADQSLGANLDAGARLEHLVKLPQRHPHVLRGAEHQDAITCKVVRSVYAWPSINAHP